MLSASLSGCGASVGGGHPTDGKVEKHAAPLRATFALLRDDAEPATRLMKDRMGEGAAAALGAHEARTPNGPIWLVASNSGRICLFAGRPPASACESSSLALKQGLTIGVVESPSDPSRRRFVLYGVVPDGRTSVKVRIGEHRIRTIPVRSGAFSMRAREPVFKL